MPTMWVETLFSAFSAPLWMHNPHSPRFLLSLPKARKGSTRETPLSHPLSPESGCGCHGQDGELLVTCQHYTHRGLPGTLAPADWEKAPQGQSMPCVLLGECALYYLMALWPKNVYLPFLSSSLRASLYSLPSHIADFQKTIMPMWEQAPPL